MCLMSLVDPSLTSRSLAAVAWGEIRTRCLLLAAYDTLVAKEFRPSLDGYR